jgi:D-alanyl-lipoteichoic acid acyltransferase DltB (MBOAT superfamily)
VVDYFAGRGIERSSGKNKKRWLLAGVISTVGVLVFFKYFNFLNEQVTYLLGWAGRKNPIPYLDIILPIGLSFHTFQALSYLIEVYYGNQKPEKHFGIFSLYVMFYPQLVAGPIERPQNLLHQFYEHHSFENKRVIAGLRLMLWGLFKKTVIADRLTHYVDAVYNGPMNYSGAELLLIVFLFAFQVYCDFSGYSDIALGSARVMGFTLMVNFNRPFQSQSVTEFWRRWHISLYTWFSDYIMMPLLTTFRNYGQRAVLFGIWITFFLSGLWHGAGWTFITLGLLHAAALTYELYTKPLRKKTLHALPGLVSKTATMVLTFIFCSITFVFFRADSMNEAFYILGHAANPSGPFYHLFPDLFAGTDAALGVVFIVMMMITEAYTSPVMDELNHKPVLNFIFCLVTSLLILNFGAFNAENFIYFQF